MSINNAVNSSTAPYFDAQLGSAVTNQTGDGTVYQVIFATENTDIGGGYNPATGLYTAPIAGDYFFQWNVGVTSLGAAMTSGDGVYLNSSNLGNNYSVIGNYFAMSSSGSLYLCGACIIRMTTSGTASIKVMIAGGTKTVGVGDTGGTRFRGRLIGVV